MRLSIGEVEGVRAHRRSSRLGEQIGAGLFELITGGFRARAPTGGPAGLTAATYLARYRRSVAVYDAGHSRAALFLKATIIPYFHRVSGKELLKRLTRQAEFYNVPLKHAIISALERMEDGYRASYEGGEVTARRILLATGIVDAAPKIKGLDDAVEKGLVRYCPVCDAFEASDKRIAVLGGGDAAISKAKFLRDYSRDVTLL